MIQEHQSCGRVPPWLLKPQHVMVPAFLLSATKADFPAMICAMRGSGIRFRPIYSTQHLFSPSWPSPNIRTWVVPLTSKEVPVKAAHAPPALIESATAITSHRDNFSRAKKSNLISWSAHNIMYIIIKLYVMAVRSCYIVCICLHMSAYCIKTRCVLLWFHICPMSPWFFHAASEIFRAPPAATEPP